jgi:hypothetical protein
MSYRQITKCDVCDKTAPPKPIDWYCIMADGDFTMVRISSSPSQAANIYIWREGLDQKPKHAVGRMDFCSTPCLMQAFQVKE